MGIAKKNAQLYWHNGLTPNPKAQGCGTQAKHGHC